MTNPINSNPYLPPSASMISIIQKGLETQLEIFYQDLANLANDPTNKTLQSTLQSDMMSLSNDIAVSKRLIDSDPSSATDDPDFLSLIAPIEQIFNYQPQGQGFTDNFLNAAMNNPAEYQKYMDYFSQNRMTFATDILCPSNMANNSVANLVNYGLFDMPIPDASTFSPLLQTNLRFIQQDVNQLYNDFMILSQNPQSPDAQQAVRTDSVKLYQDILTAQGNLQSGTLGDLITFNEIVSPITSMMELVLPNTSTTFIDACQQYSANPAPFNAFMSALLNNTTSNGEYFAGPVEQVMNLLNQYFPPS